MPERPMTISTPRLLLRAAHQHDAVALHALFTDPEVMRYWYEARPSSPQIWLQPMKLKHIPLIATRSTPPHKTPAETSTWVDGMIASPTNGITDFIIVRTRTPDPNGKDSGGGEADVAIGKIGIYSTGKPEIGFLIERAYWRQGLASEALTHVLPYLFREKGFDEVTADIDPRNQWSKVVLERCGFVVVGCRERTFEIEGAWVDSLDLRLGREAFLSGAEGA